MRATGIVRRIDNLGRIVIPKEIRRVLRIRDDDPVEIFTDEDGKIILKKYSPIGEMADFASQYADALYKSSGMITFITDREKVVAVGGINENEYLDLKISDALYQKLENRTSIMASKRDRDFVTLFEKSIDFEHEIICPIVADYEVIGSVIMINKSGENIPTDVEFKLATCGAGFMGLHSE